MESKKGVLRTAVLFAVFIVFTVLVCLSVLFVKQHALIDLPAAFLIAELSLQPGRLLKLERIGLSLEKRLDRDKE